ncbi:MAG: energy transducer TonB [Treponema sp.]|jgi:protein TonB|nr:energy transducer TonB [Treponema sp.]
MKKIRIIAFLAALLTHVSFLVFLHPGFQPAEPEQQEERPRAVKLIDVQEFQPQVIQPPPPAPPPPMQIPTTRRTTEQVIETDVPPPEATEQPASTDDFAGPDRFDTGGDGTLDVNYLPQNKISEVPKIDADRIRNNIVYPPIALRAGVEGTVILELFIDSKGEIRRISILKEDPPERGFGESAINAFKGITAIPAESNGQAVAVRYRYPVRFKVSKRL